MATKRNTPKRNLSSKDKGDNNKFMLILVGATFALIVLMYFIFVG